MTTETWGEGFDSGALNAGVASGDDILLELNRARASAGRYPHVDESVEAAMLARLVQAFGAGSGLDDPLADQLVNWAATARTVQEAVADLVVLRGILDDRLARIPNRGLGVDAAALGPAIDAAMVAVAAQMTSRLAEEALLDPLTELGNRRALDFHLDRAVAMMSRSDVPISVVSVDLDGLKQINDTRGHQAGDEALTGLARALNACLREADGAYRVGGDEFVVVLIGTPPGDVARVMERVSAAGAPKFSWGVAAAPIGALDAASVVDAADQQLYERRRHQRRPTVGARLLARLEPVFSGAKLILAAAAGAAIALALALSQATPSYPPMGLAPNAGGPIPQAQPQAQPQAKPQAQPPATPPVSILSAPVSLGPSIALAGFTSAVPTSSPSTPTDLAPGTPTAVGSSPGATTTSTVQPVSYVTSAVASAGPNGHTKGQSHADSKGHARTHGQSHADSKGHGRTHGQSHADSKGHGTDHRDGQNRPGSGGRHHPRSIHS